MNERIANAINTLGNFCGKRDVEALTAPCLQNSYGIPQVDVMVLFGGSILCGGDVLAQAMHSQIARTYVIVGGEGHTTQTLRDMVHKAYPSIHTDGLPEAEVFNRYLHTAYGLQADFLEKKSTNCGNNITYLLKLLERHKIRFNSMILCQDATMQRRMDAGLRKYVPEGRVIINYATYRAEVAALDGQPVYATDIRGMWTVERYVELLMGEIPRLTDDANGYGPNGKQFIAHVDIPQEVHAAFAQLKDAYGGHTREANPFYASKPV